MEILHVITTINRGGAENHLCDLVEGQIGEGINVTVAFLKGDGYWQSRLELSGCQVINLKMRFPGDWLPLARLVDFFKKNCPVIVHAHLPLSEMYSHLSLSIIKSPPIFVVTKHNDERFLVKGRVGIWLGKYVLKRANAVIAISGAVKRYFVDSGIVPDEKVRVIYYGIHSDPSVFPSDLIKETRADWGAEKGTLIIGAVARLTKQKAVHVLLDGFKEFKVDTKQDSLLVVVGQGPLEMQLKERAGALGIADSVVWAGFREDIPVIMQAIDIFALTSLYEGFGLVLLEAMIAARPVVATRVSAIPEVIGECGGGVLVPPGDPKALSNVLGHLEDEEKRYEIGLKGQRRVVERFTVERMVEKTLLVYHSCQ